MTDVVDGTGKLHHFVDRWKAVLGAVVSAMVAVWISVTWAEDKIRKIERVPLLEEMVLQMKLSIEVIQNDQAVRERRMSRMEQRMEKIDRIDDKLDILLEKVE